MKKIYNPCCNRRCLLSFCETRESGGCYCICTLMDEIHTIEGVIQGTHFNRGCCYIPDENVRNRIRSSWTNEMRNTEEKFRTDDAPKILQSLKDRLEKFKVKDGMDQR